MASSFPGAIDSFTDPLSGSALNSPSHSAQHADLNDAAEKIETYMGLVKVIPTSVTGGTLSATGTITVGSAVSSVVVSGAFSSLYEGYKIVVSGGAPSADSYIRLVLGSSITGYYSGRNGMNWSAGTRTDGTDNNSARFTAVGTSLTSGLAAEITLINPNLAKYTDLVASYNTTSSSVLVNGIHRVATAFTAFTISPDSGTWTGGTVTVYGYRI
jgi:hypothetical protein